MGSSSETLPSDSGTISGGKKSGCNIVYESSNPDKSANDKCFDNSSDGGKIVNDNKRSAGGKKNGTELEKTNVLEAKIKNSRQETSLVSSKRDLKPSIDSDTNKKLVEVSNEEKDLRKKSKNESGSEDNRKSSKNGTKKK